MDNVKPTHLRQVISTDWLTKLFRLAVETAAQQAHSPRGIQEKRSHAPWAVTRLMSLASICERGLPETLIYLVHAGGLCSPSRDFKRHS